jgi:hypothetical protein
LSHPCPGGPRHLVGCCGNRQSVSCRDGASARTEQDACPIHPGPAWHPENLRTPSRVEQRKGISPFRPHGTGRDTLASSGSYPPASGRTVRLCVRHRLPLLVPPLESRVPLLCPHCGGLNPDPAIRVRGAYPHLLCSKAAQSWFYIDTSSSRRRGAPSSAKRTRVLFPLSRGFTSFSNHSSST